MNDLFLPEPFMLVTQTRDRARPPLPRAALLAHREHFSLEAILNAAVSSPLFQGAFRPKNDCQPQSPGRALSSPSPGRSRAAVWLLLGGAVQVLAMSVCLCAAKPVCPPLQPWLVDGTTTSTVFTDAAKAAAHVDVQSVCKVKVNGAWYYQVNSTGIPNYTRALNEDDLELLADHIIMGTGVCTPGGNVCTEDSDCPASLQCPAAPGNCGVDYRSGTPYATYPSTLVKGSIVEFGADIGFDGRPNCWDPSTCTANQGSGYWPPGPGCPTVKSNTFLIPASPKGPVPAGAMACRTNPGAIGKWVNGVSMFNYWDGNSYNDLNVWHNVAPHWEKGDFDICQGHSPANGEYHHHSYPRCLGDRLKDNGHQASPILGYAADGYPVLGPWVIGGSLARTCWKTRIFDGLSKTGCPGSPGRTCQLMDPMHYDAGYISLFAPAQGPDIFQVVTPDAAIPWRTMMAVSGVFVEDYYYDQSCVDHASDLQLDEHNGHVTGSREAADFKHTYYMTLSGYHYHTVRVKTGGYDANGDPALEDVFPFTVGPTFYGVVPVDTKVKCGDPYVP